MRTCNDRSTTFRRALAALVVLLALAPALVFGRPPDGGNQARTYIVELQDPPLAVYDGRTLSVPLPSGRESLAATNPESRGQARLDMDSAAARAYIDFLNDRQQAFLMEASVELSRPVRAERSYRNATNGVALTLTPVEAGRLSVLPMVKSLHADRTYKLHTDAGPEWLGADVVWDGFTDHGAAQGEGVVVGLIDSGINWEHPSFADQAGDGYNHTNPYGVQLGLCSQGNVECNDKLVGVYDFVEDNPSTSDVVEENTDGRDNSGHGSHVAGIAVGNRLQVELNGSETTEISGVAPRANIVSYRVCYIGDPPEPDGGGCQGAAILDAIDQAIDDGVDVINYSIGTNAFDPWAGGNTPAAFLNARIAGIVVATSSGNEGPNAGTVGSPANAPWILAVGNTTHNRIFGSLVQDMSGGGAPPPDDLIGASLTGGLSKREIVHAADYGFPLCGTGPAELQPTCAGNQGNSNPWAGNPVFNGEIVVCNRGNYGRVEKGKNVMLAGAGGYILANTGEQGEEIVADDHCLPATHVGEEAGDELRHWLSFGSGHMGAISGFTLAEGDQFADRLALTSSRGPVDPPVQDTLKPNLIAPGTDILSAYFEAEQFNILSGTSMASPHVAGAAALLKSLHPDWSTAQIVSAIETTAAPQLATTETGAVAGPHERGAGRPQLGNAADAGLYLNVSGAQFDAADPLIGGDPKDLNLAAMVDSACRTNCSFVRAVTDMVGGGSWQATAVDFPAGANVTISPNNFNLADGGTRAMNISIDLAGSGLVGQWVYGRIRLRSTGLPDQYLTTAVFYDGGSLPEEWTLTSDENAGWAEMNLSGLVAMPDATFTSGGLVRPTITTQTLVQDPTANEPEIENEDPFDGGPGTFTVWHTVPEGALWLHAETLASTSNDLDLFIGRDDNQNGITEEFEVLCSSTTPTDLELCDLLTPAAGEYWIIVQNWDTDSPQGDEATLVSAVVGGNGNSDLVASGPGIVGANESFDLRLSWSNVDAVPGEQFFGAVGLGTSRDNPNNVGVMPVVYNRTGISAPQTLPLMSGREHKLALGGNSNHDRMYIDVPPGVTDMVIEVSGRGAQQSNNLAFDLYRHFFSGALNNPPFDVLPGDAELVASVSGANGDGPSLAINDAVPPGRYFIDLANTRGSASSVTVQVDLQSSDTGLNPHKGLWNFSRAVFQGSEWNSSGSFSTVLWYSYDEDGQPTWYIASGPSPAGNVWVADLLRVTNDGAQQQEKTVGVVSMTFLADDSAVMSYTLFGESGFDPLVPNQANTCPQISGSERSYSGLWYRGVAGLGGASVVVYEQAQAQVHYLFDDFGNPRWLIAADDGNQSATAEVIPLLQFDGFCAVCAPETVVWDTVGSVSRTFDSETTGSWTLDFELLAPLQLLVDRTDSIVKLSTTLECQ